MTVENVAHEGSHVRIDKAYIDSGFATPLNIMMRQAEIISYQVSQAVADEYGMKAQDPNTGNLLDLHTDRQINNFLNSLPQNTRNRLDDPIDSPIPARPRQ